MKRFRTITLKGPKPSARLVRQIGHLKMVYRPRMQDKRGLGVHTVPNPRGSGWINELWGLPQPRVFRVKFAAVEVGKKLAKKHGAEHTIHNKDGKIGLKNSYGNDPRNVKG